ncbi:LamG-like jellyroll fold domain-containing protein [Kitasatospora sp. NPDC088264]|uniref:LamG-like jellyroll fold domain-containing protein n=1 Tax=Kitasatospora sp. NPDC088264 TaxID=3155296 RepID=UPI00342D4391
MSVSDGVVKVYSDRTYSSTTVVRHQGTTVAFAMDDQRRIVYSVLALGAYDPARGEADAAYWTEDPLELSFPEELVRVGYAALGTVTMPHVKKGGRVEAEHTQVLAPQESDPFLSSTARLTAAVPFQVLSDGTYVVVLRQSVAAGHPDAVREAGSGRASGGATGAALVDSALLCDRFLLVDGVLKPVREIRYRRSRSKDRPDSAKDSLGGTDMEGRPFREPTQVLGFVRNLSEGRFTALLVPTSVAGTGRWQFFSHNTATSRIDALSVEQSTDGLFDTRGSRAWTSPDPAYQGAVYEREPGTCPFTGAPLVPVASRSGSGETALRLAGPDAAAAVAGVRDGPEFTVEVWLRPERAAATTVYTDGFVLELAEGGVPLLSGSGTVTGTRALAAGEYAHLAVVCRDGTATLHVDGLPCGTGPFTPPPGTGTAVLGGAGRNVAFDADELRIWDRARAQDELRQDRGHRLVGDEPGLVAYYRFDEASGSVAHDQTDRARHAALSGAVSWVTSTAPVGEHAGIRRDSFSFAARTVLSAPSAILYHQQEAQAAGYHDVPKPAKHQTRVLLSCATGDAAAPDAEPRLAVLDLAVGADGRLAQVADVLTLPDLTTREHEDLDHQSALEQRIKGLRTEIADLRAQSVTLTATCADIPARQAAEDATRHALTAAEAQWELQRDNPADWDNAQLRFTRPDGHSYWVGPQGNTLHHKNPLNGWDTVPGISSWRFVYSGWRDGVGRKLYFIRLVNGGYQMNVYGGTSAEGSYVQLYNSSNANTANELFAVIPQSEGTYQIVAYHSGKTLAIRAAGGNYLAQYTSSTVMAGGEGRCRIDRISWSGADTAFTAARNAHDAAQEQLQALLAAQEQLNDVTLQLAVREAALTSAQDELGRFTDGLSGTDDVTVAAAHLGTDATGLGSTGGLLSFARTSSRPFLMDSATGHVALYFRGLNDQFFAAYYDTQVVRGTKTLGIGDAALLFTARDAGVDLTGVSVSVTAVQGQPGLCDLTIDLPGDREVWRALPRDTGTLVDVLSGATHVPQTLGTAAEPVRTDGPDPSDASDPSAAEATLGLAAPLGRPLAAPAYIATDDGVRLLTESAPAGATALRVDRPCRPAPGSPVRLVPYDPALARAERPGADLSRGSRLVTVAAASPDARVQDGTADDAVVGQPCRWRGSSPGRAFAFNGTDQYLALPAAALPTTTTASNVTVEAWVNPYRATRTACLVHAANDADAPYSLLLADATARTAVVFDGADDQVSVDGLALSGTALTIELWARRAVAAHTASETILSYGAGALSLSYDQAGTVSFALGSEVLTTAASYTDTDWHHWAAVLDPATRTQVLYRDGVEAARRSTARTVTRDGRLVLGGLGAAASFRGGIDSLRVWNRARTADEIRDLMRQNVASGLPGLLGSWTCGDQQFLDTSGHGRHGVLGGTPQAGESHSKGYRVVAGVGERAVRSRDVFPAGEWAHVASAFEQSWAVRLDGSSWLDSDGDDSLGLTGDLTLEVFGTLERLGTTQGLITRGRLGGEEHVPYQLSVRPDGRLEFAFEEAGPVVRRFVSTATVPSGRFTRIAVVKRAGRETTEQRGTRQIALTGPDGAGTTQTVDVVQGVDVHAWDDITFYIDGTPTGTSRYTGPGPESGTGTLEIGRVREGMRTYGTRGVLGEVRIWNKARDAAVIGTPVSPRDTGLVARFTFEENTGSTTTDTTGAHTARLRGATWTRDPDPRASVFRLYRNGIALATDPVDAAAPDSPTHYGERQFTLGARLAGTTVTDALDGTLEEVRVWRTARTAEQISDNLFTRLKGDKEDLIGYWPFDRDSTSGGTDVVRDMGLRGNHLRPGPGAAPTVVLSTAPVSTDTAAVRSAVSGVRTPFHETVATAPAVGEYADMQYAADGTATGVMKRAYSYLTEEGRWRLVTGYKVGDLVSEWVSQVQYDPQLIGYIEGAPPVPSENLTGQGNDYRGASSVGFTTADSVTESLSSSRDRSADAAFHFAFKNTYDADTLLIMAPLGIGTAKPAVKGGAVLSLDNTLEFTNTWTDATTLTQATDTARATTVALTGHWEDPAHLLNPALGRRYQPANTGFALVQSQTADVFALRLAHTGTLVAYRMLPNPDIPRDWNILTFPINPQYTKQGTLDGGVGFDEHGKVLDPAYPNAQRYGEYSYYKPREAYALKRAIQRRRQQLRSYYESVSTATGTPDPTQQRAARIAETFVGPIDDNRGESTGQTAADGAVVRDLANTYVWTADGGFFAETTTTTDSVTETTAGSYTVKDMATAGAEFGFTVFGVGIGAQLDASLGGSHSVTRTRARDASRSYSLDVDCRPSGDLQAYSADGQTRFDPDGSPRRVPGKVDAYRFMSFYLHESGDNFDDFFHKVVDPLWLAGSSAPSAAALRQTQQSDRKPPCWRVLHRVTFVSRILPPVPAADTPPLEQDLVRADIASNYELVRRLDPYVRQATATRTALAAATRTALTTHLPHLLAHEEAITRFLTDYYGVTE